MERKSNFHLTVDSAEGTKVLLNSGATQCKFAVQMLRDCFTKSKPRYQLVSPNQCATEVKRANKLRSKHKLNRAYAVEMLNLGPFQSHERKHTLPRAPLPHHRSSLDIGWLAGLWCRLKGLRECCRWNQYRRRAAQRNLQQLCRTAITST